MAGPGDPKHPDDHDDDLIGFASPASLQGRERGAARGEPEGESGPEPNPAPTQPASEPAADLFSFRPEPAAMSPVELGAMPASTPLPESSPLADGPARPSAEPAPAPGPVDAVGIFAPSPGFTERRRRPRPAPLPGGGMSLYVVYALILFAVPTMGVAALVGLLAVGRRDGPEDPVSRSHFIYQQRTLWATAVVAGAGLILLAAPLALGVPILFGLALWLVARGATGVWALKAGRPIDDPRDWWVDWRRPL